MRVVSFNLGFENWDGVVIDDPKHVPTDSTDLFAEFNDVEDAIGLLCSSDSAIVERLHFRIVGNPLRILLRFLECKADFDIVGLRIDATELDVYLRRLDPSLSAVTLDEFLAVSCDAWPAIDYVERYESLLSDLAQNNGASINIRGGRAILDEDEASLQARLNFLQRKYDALANSKLGRLQQKYWHLKRKIR